MDRTKSWAYDLPIKNGWLCYIYLSNDNVALGGQKVEVYFDDLKVVHVKSSVVQSQDYYPFGLTFNMHQRTASLIDRYQYNGKRLQTH